MLFIVIFRKDQIVAHLHRLNQGKSLAGGGLSIVVQTNHNIAGDVMKAGDNGGMLSKILCKINAFDFPVLPGQAGDDIKYTVWIISFTTVGRIFSEL